MRLVVLQESKITASATALPAPHNKLSRLPRIHRVSLDRHTSCEYAQKQKNLTTHFFGFFPTSIAMLPMPARETPRPPILRRRSARKLFEYAIELREGLKSRSECDFADAHITVSQEVTGGDEASARDVLDEIDTSHVLEIFA